MEDLQSNDEMAISQDEIEKFITDTIEATLNNINYQESKVQHWINSICENLMKKLVDMKKPFKYMTNCIIMQRNGAGLISTNTCYWDTIADVVVSVEWPKAKQKDNNNKTMYCIVTVYAVSI